MLVDRFLKPLREVGLYGAFSAGALAVDVGTLQLLNAVLGLHYLVASIISFVAGGVALYAMSVRFVFKARRVDNRTLELSFFLALGLIGLVINSVVLYVAVGAWHLPVLGGKLMA